MPIRFYCHYCDQRLSVSRRKACTLVKCPTCHESVEVPTEEDADRDAAARKEQKKTRSRSKSGKKERSAGTVMAPPVIEAVEAPAAETELPVAVLEGLDRGSPSSATTMVQRRAQAQTKVNYDKVTIPRNYVYAQGALLLVASIVCFVLGVIAGQSILGPDKDGEGPVASHVQGNIQFENSDDERTPDDQSVVILLPTNKRPPQSIEVVDIRPTDAAPIEDHPSLVAIRSIGGGYARADANGEFHIDLPNGGRFYMLVISRNHKSADNVNNQVISQLGRYVVSSEELIGDRDYRWTEEYFEGTQSLDVVFANE